MVRQYLSDKNPEEILSVRFLNRYMIVKLCYTLDSEDFFFLKNSAKHNNICSKEHLKDT